MQAASLPAPPTRFAHMRSSRIRWGKPATFVPIEGVDPLEHDELAAEIKSIAEALRAERDASQSVPGLQRVEAEEQIDHAPMSKS